MKIINKIIVSLVICIVISMILGLVISFLITGNSSADILIYSIGATLALIVLIAMVFWYVDANIINPIKKIAKDISVISQTEDYKKELKYNKKDELGLVTSSFNMLMKEINNNKEGFERLLDERTDGLVKFSKAIDQTSSQVVITDTDWIIEYVNTAYTVVTGYSYQESIGMNLDMFRSDALDNNIYNKMKQVVSSGNDWHGTYCNMNKQGCLYFEESTISPIKNDAGVIINYVFIKEDITEKRRLETNYKALFENIPFGFAENEVVYDKHNNIVDYKFISTNEAFFSLTGFGKEIIGKSLGDVLPRHFDFWNSRYKQVIKTSKSMQFEKSVRLGDKYCSVYVFSPEQGRLVTILEDITDNVFMTKKLKESENRSKLAIKSAKMSTWEWDIKKNIVTFSSQMTELVSVDFEEKSEAMDVFLRYTHPDDKQTLEKLINNCLDNFIDQYEIEYRYYDEAKKRYVWLQSNGLITERDANGNALVLLTTARNIDEAKQREVKIKESEQRLRLAVNASNIVVWEHDFETDSTKSYGYFKKIYGYETHEFSINKLHLKFIHPDDKQFVSDIMSEKLKNRDPSLSVEFRYWREDLHKYIWIRSVASIVWGDGTERLRMTGTSMNITKEKESEAKLSNLLEASNSIINSIPASTFVFHKKTKKITNYNKAILKVWTLNEFDDNDHKKITGDIKDFDKILEIFEEYGEVKGFETKIGGGGFVIPMDITLSVNSIDLMGEEYAIITFFETTKAKIASKRMEVLKTIAEHQVDDKKSFFDFSLEQVTNLKDSNIGFMFEKDGQDDIVYRYSEPVGFQRRYDDEKFDSLWPKNPKLFVNSINDGKPIIINDYHTEDVNGDIIKSFMIVPLLEGDQVVGVIGVGGENKIFEESDARDVMVIMDSIWRKIKLHGVKKDMINAKISAETIVESCPVPIAIIDLDTSRIIRANDAYYEFHRISEFDYYNDEEIFVDMNDPVNIARMLDAKGYVSNYEMENKRIGTGERVWVLADVNKLVYQGKDCHILVFIDVSANKEVQMNLEFARQEAEQASRAKSEFLANMSHEIRTPMNAVIGLNDLLFDTKLTPKQRDYVGKVRRSAKNLLKIINDILDISKLESGMLNMENKEFDVENVLKDIVDVCALKAFQKNIELIIQKDINVPKMLIGDSFRLNQILLNLVGNAIKFTSEGMVFIDVKVESINNDKVALKFCVKDSGIGMTGSQMKNLFFAFSQADASTTRKYGGTGLGLVISKDIAQLMGGDIDVESQIGLGSTFTLSVSFDIASKSEPTYNGMIIEEEKTALIISENDNLKKVFNGYLEPIGVKTIMAINLEGAIKCSELEKLDFIIIDNQLSDVNGINVYRKINSVANAQSAKVVLLADYNNHDALEIAHDEGFDKVLLKPILQYDLYNALMDEASERQISDDPYLKLNIYPAGFDKVRGARILLVEDNDINRQVVSEVLMSEGFYIEAASDGEKAIDKALSGQYDIILMDLQMPIMDGYLATSTLVKKHKIETPIIALSADAITGVKERVLQAGAKDYVSKPIDRKELFAVLAKYIEPNSRKLNVYKEEIAVMSHDYVDLKKTLIDFDVDRSIYRSNDSTKLYIKLIKKFRENYGFFADDVEKLLLKEKIEETKKYIHIIKGVVGNISAFKLYEEVVLAEESLNESNSISEKLLSDLKILSKRANTQIDNFFKRHEANAQKQAKGEVISEKELLKKMKKLLLMLGNYNTEAEELCMQLLTYDIDSEIKSNLTYVYECISDFEFEKASITLNKCLNML